LIENVILNGSVGTIAYCIKDFWKELIQWKNKNALIC